MKCIPIEDFELDIFDGFVIQFTKDKSYNYRDVTSELTYNSGSKVVIRQITCYMVGECPLPFNEEHFLKRFSDICDVRNKIIDDIIC